MDAINALEAEMKRERRGLAAKTAEFRSELAGGKTLDDILVRPCGRARGALRVLGLRPFDVQLIGGMICMSEPSGK